MIDNFKQVRSMLAFNTPNTFYFVQVIKRRKDNPGLPRDEKKICEYSIYSLEEFDKREVQIKEEADDNNARVYIHLTTRDAYKIALKTLLLIGEHIDTGSPKAARYAYASACGRYPDKKNGAIWLIDVDVKENSFVQEMLDLLSTLSVKIYDVLPTKNGSHIITSPFRRGVFKSKYPDIGIQTDALSLLYMPDIK